MTREDALARIESAARWDVLVVGGGATGLGAALDAAARGHRTLLLEQDDFAKGTSSRSTKLIHGGVRYLRQGRLRLVREALRERARLLRNAPHLVRELGFVIPLYHRWEAAFYGVGLKLYDRLAGSYRLEPSRVLSREETIERLPTVETRGLRGGVRFTDAQFDDARLALALGRTLVEQGGVAANYVRVVELRRHEGRVAGVVALDRESGRRHAVEARVVINATGVFGDELRRLDDPRCTPAVRPSRGVHLVLGPEFLPAADAILVPHTSDGRVLFALPWRQRVIVGTTDTPVERAELEPRASEPEIEFLLEHAGRYLSRAPGRGDVRSVFGGLRPLAAADAGRSTAGLSRDHSILVSNTGLVTITGGKWTTYRAMAQDVVDRAEGVGGLEPRPCVTAELRLHGADGAQASEPHLDGYGADAERLVDLARAEPGLDAPLAADLPLRGSQVVFAAREEMARTVEDVLARRTRSLVLDARASAVAAPAAARLLARELGRDAEWEQRQVAAYRELAAGYLP